MQKQILLTLALMGPMTTVQGSYPRLAAGMYKTGKVANIALTFGLAGGMALYRDEINQEYATNLSQPISEKARVWFDDRAKECGMDPKKLSFKQHNNALFAGTMPLMAYAQAATIVATPAFVNAIQNEESLVPFAFAQMTRGAAATLVRHELGHCHNQHNEKTIANGTTMAACGGVHLLSLMLRKKTLPTTMPMALGRTGLLLFGGACKGLVGNFGGLGLCRPFIEDQADRFAAAHTKDPQELHDTATLFEAMVIGERHILSQAPAHMRLIAAFSKMFHPDGMKRVAFFRAEAAKLEAKQKNQ